MEDLSYWEKNALTRPQFNHPATQIFIENILNIIKNKISNIKDLTLLDCGCGNGRYLAHFNKLLKSAYGFDYSLQMIKQAKAAGITNVMEGNGLNIPFNDDSFDISFGACYIHNLSSELKAVKEMVRISKKYIVIIEPNPVSALGIYHLVTPYEKLHSLKLTSSYIKKLLKKCNTRILYSAKFSYITPNKTPKTLIPILRIFPLQRFFGFYTITIAIKSG